MFINIKPNKVIDQTGIYRLNFRRIKCCTSVFLYSDVTVDLNLLLSIYKQIRGIRNIRVKKRRLWVIVIIEISKIPG